MSKYDWIDELINDELINHSKNNWTGKILHNYFHIRINKVLWPLKITFNRDYFGKSQRQKKKKLFLR